MNASELPRIVVMELPQGSAVKSMDFHPIKPNILLVGTNTGDVMVWDLVTRNAVSVKFKVWVRYSVSLQDVSINRVKWSPEGTLFGVAYSMHLVHLFSYTNSSDFCELRNPLEIEAHAGSVNDLAFSYPIRQLCVVTCGEDMLVKVWDATMGTRQYTFQGHESPVCCVCPSHKLYIQFIYSIATDGKIKRWHYDEDLTVTYNALFPPSTTMAFSTDGSRLFSCGADFKGKSFLVERTALDYTVRRTYEYLANPSVEVAQFDTTRDRFLVVGHDKLVKYWDKDKNVNLFVIEAGGGLTDSPCVRFNSDGTLLAVSTINNGVKILAKCSCVKIYASGCRCVCCFGNGLPCKCTY